MKGLGVPIIAAGGIDLNLHVAIIKLAITYTLALAFIFTVVITCLSLLGWVKFANKSQQKKLFAAVIVQVVIACAGVFSDFLSVTPSEVKADIASEYQQTIDSLDAQIKERQQILAEQEARLAQTNRQLADAQREASTLKAALTARDLELAKTKATLNEAITKLPAADRRRLEMLSVRGGG